MDESVRLSEASRAAAEALANFDHAALESITERMQAAVRGKVLLQAEAPELVENNQRLLAGVLKATEQNIALLRRLRERKAANEWAL